MMEAVVSLAMPDNWITDVVEMYPSVIRVIDSKDMKEGVRDLVQIDVENEEDLPRSSSRCAATLTSSMWTSAPWTRPGAAAFSTNHCMACRLLAGTECFLTGSTTTKEGRLKWTMLVTQKKALQELIENLGKINAAPKLVKLTELSDTDELTKRQEQVTRMAYERGYFDFPRRVGLKELATSSACPPPRCRKYCARGRGGS